VASRQLGRKMPGRPKAQLDEQSQHNILAPKKGNSIPGSTRQSIASRLKKVILPLH